MKPPNETQSEKLKRRVWQLFYALYRLRINAIELYKQGKCTDIEKFFDDWLVDFRIYGYDASELIEFYYSDQLVFQIDKDKLYQKWLETYDPSRYKMIKTSDT